MIDIWSQFTPPVLRGADVYFSMKECTDQVLRPFSDLDNVVATKPSMRRIQAGLVDGLWDIKGRSEKIL